VLLVVSDDGCGGLGWLAISARDARSWASWLLRIRDGKRDTRSRRIGESARGPRD
jgi:hypothetical protein